VGGPECSERTNTALAGTRALPQNGFVEILEKRVGRNSSAGARVTAGGKPSERSVREILPRRFCLLGPAGNGHDLGLRSHGKEGGVSSCAASGFPALILFFITVSVSGAIFISTDG